jgi:hypothetical protein
MARTKPARPGRKRQTDTSPPELARGIATVIDQLVLRLMASGDPGSLALAETAQLMIHLYIGDYESENEMDSVNGPQKDS